MSKKIETELSLDEACNWIKNKLHYYNYDTILFAMKLIEADILNKEDSDFITIAIDATHGSGKTFVAHFLYLIYNINFLSTDKKIKKRYNKIIEDVTKQYSENRIYKFNENVNEFLKKLEGVKKNILDKALININEKMIDCFMSKLKDNKVRELEDRVNKFKNVEIGTIRENIDVIIRNCELIKIDDFDEIINILNKMNTVFFEHVKLSEVENDVDKSKIELANDVNELRIKLENNVNELRNSLENDVKKIEEGLNKINDDITKCKIGKLDQVKSVLVSSFRLTEQKMISSFYEKISRKLCIYISMNNQDYDLSLENVLNIVYNAVAMQFKNGILEINTSDKELMKVVKKGLIQIAKGVLKDKDSMIAAEKTIDLIKDLNGQTKVSYKKNFSRKKIQNFNDSLESFKEILVKNNAIFIVDNLDKCNPQFLVSFIDKIKYLFIDKKIPFVFMVDNEYFLELSEANYGMNISLSYYYSNIFHNVHKLYLKPKDEFIEDLLNKKEEDLKYYKQFYSANKEYITKLHNEYHLSLHEIETLIKRFNTFMEKNIFLTDARAIKYILYCVYCLLALQIIDIKSFNSILYDEEKLSQNKSCNSKKSIICINRQMSDFICNLKEKIMDLTTLFVIDDIGYKFDNINKFMYKIVENKSDEYSNKIKIYDGGTELTEMDVGKFNLSLLFNYEDIKYGTDKLLNMTMGEYLRYKISQF